MKVQGEGGVREEDERWKGHIRNFGGVSSKACIK